MENKNNNKKIIVPTIISILTLVMLAIGATYSYFLVGTTNNFETKIITATTPSIGSVALTTGDNLTMSLTASQMMAGSADITYYASSEGTTTTATTANIGVATVVGEGRYKCDYTLTVDDNENSLYDAFQEMSAKSNGQIVLSINGSEYDFNTENLFSKTITRTMTGLTTNTPQNITAELKLVNKVDLDQSELAGKELTLTFTASNFSCTAEEENKGVDYVLSTSSPSDLWNSELEEDGIRFIGTDPNNYICFGTQSVSDCTGNTDLYMYRIIGIFPDAEGNQHLKLIKKEALNTAYAWHSDDTVDIDWAESDLYNGLNGSYFLTNTAYSYMQNTNWTNKIATWDYTATNTKTSESSGVFYSTLAIRSTYLHEMNRNTKTNTIGEWNPASSKIALIYFNDYVLSLGSGSLSYRLSDIRTTLKTSWIHLSNNDSGAPSSYEWTMTRYGFYDNPNGGYYEAWIVNSNGHGGHPSVDMIYSARPVFYLTDGVTISGEGTPESPFIVS